MKLLIKLVSLIAYLLSLSSAATAAEEVVHGVDHFKFLYRMRFPAIEQTARVWLPLAQSSLFQEVKIEHITAPCTARQLLDRSGRNQILLLSAGKADSGKLVEVAYDVVRHEKQSYRDDVDPAPFLLPNRLVPLNDTFSSIASNVLRDAPVGRAPGRAIYDHVLARMKYDKTVAGCGGGDALNACETKAGNCTDFSSYFMAVARAARIPVRFGIGVSLPADRAEGPVNGYHCWVDFADHHQWVPLDISEASKHPELGEYYFGHQPANRFELSQGRDLEVDPLPASGAINFLVYPVMEVDGKSIAADTEFTFRTIKD